MLSFSVSKATFDISKANNPRNLRDQCDYCNNPQPRFYENPHPQAQAKFKHIAYKQCLPGCVGSPDVEVKIADTQLTHGGSKRVNHTNHSSCEPYDGSNKYQIKNTGSSLGQGKKKKGRLCVKFGVQVIVLVISQFYKNLEIK